MSIAEEADIKDPQLVSYYNKMIEGKERMSAIAYIKTKEASRLKNLAAAKTVAPKVGVSQNQVDSLSDQIALLVDQNNLFLQRIQTLEQVSSAGTVAP